MLSERTLKVILYVVKLKEGLLDQLVFFIFSIYLLLQVAVGFLGLRLIFLYERCALTVSFGDMAGRTGMSVATRSCREEL